MATTAQVDIDILRSQVCAALREQGYQIDDDVLVRPVGYQQGDRKDSLRQLHRAAVAYRIQRARASLERHEPRLLQYIAAPSEIKPALIEPCLIPVMPRSEFELLFRYVSLHWSIPVSSGYGRRMRFLVFDQFNGKLMGIIGLGDPVFALTPRDEWVGWSAEIRRERLRYVMDAFVLGAVPPYNALLIGKAVAMLVASNEVRAAVRMKYAGRVSRIGAVPHDGELAMITTASALGRSSIYNRIRYENRQLYHSVGFTQGYGEFHFTNTVYEDLLTLVRHYVQPTAKHASWGTGFRNRREVVRKGLQILGLSNDWSNHGVQREVFVIPLGTNTREFLSGRDRALWSYDLPAVRLYEFFRRRWLIPNLDRTDSPAFKGFSPENYALWH